MEREPELAERIRGTVSRLEPAPEVVAVPGVAGAALAVAAGRTDVIVAGPSLLTGAGLHHLKMLHRKAPSTAVVLVVGRRPRASLRDIVRVGADDALPSDVGDDELLVAFDRVLSLVRRRSGTAGPVAAAPGRGRIVTVASPTEGCGKTILAANTALFLAQRTGERVVLVDLDLQFSELRTALRLKAEFSIVDALQAEAEGLPLKDVISEFMVRHDGGFSFLAAPRNPVEADNVGPGEVARVIEALQSQADWIVIDTPTGLAEHALPAFECTDDLLTVVTSDRPSVHNAGVFLTTLKTLGVTADVALVLNKAEADADLTGAIAHLPVRAVLPYDREVTRSVNLGVPLLEGTPESPAARELVRILEHLFDNSDHLPVRSSNGPATDLAEAHDLSTNAPPVFPNRRRVAGDDTWPRSPRPRRRPPVGRPPTRPDRTSPPFRRGQRVRAPPAEERVAERTPSLPDRRHLRT
ncbi:MAG: AAA family ATPase [Actinomycetota bacterium]|nr:AAA family ATPase [Actinomycetota bacterium]